MVRETQTDGWKTRSGCLIHRVRLGHANAYVCSNGPFRALVDGGPGSRWPQLARWFDERDIRALDSLFLTHAHYDHAGNAHRIRERFQARVLVHASEEDFLKNGDAPPPAGSVLPTRIFTPRIRAFVRPLFRYPGCAADVAVQDRLDLAPWGFCGYVLHTPGHSPGSMSIVMDDEVAVVGDTMFGVVPWSAFPPYADDVDQLVRSWSRLLETRCQLFLPGHGRPIVRATLERSLEKRCPGALGRPRRAGYDARGATA